MNPNAMLWLGVLAGLLHLVLGSLTTDGGASLLARYGIKRRVPVEVLPITILLCSIGAGAVDNIVDGADAQHAVATAVTVAIMSAAGAAGHHALVSSGTSNVVFLVVAFCGLLSVGCPTPPTEAEKRQISAGATAVQDGCKVVEALTASGTAKSVCAAADEIGDIVKLITAKRADAGPSFGRRASCTPLSDTTLLCATNDERLEAIEAVLRKRGGQ